MQERRRYVRWPISIPTTYYLKDSEEKFSCLAKDISLRGIKLAFTEKLAQHSVVFVNIPVKETRPLNLKAEVMWQAEEECKELYNTGLYFTSLKEDDREQILKLAGK